MSWFSSLTGFDEGPYLEARGNLELTDGFLRSRVTGEAFRVGVLETPSLAELRVSATAAADRLAGRLRVSTVVGDAGALHRDPANRDALFQVASQFNLLEMTGPDVTPEHGVTRYAHDRTQGPACAIAAGAATIYRNYFAPVDGAAGQTATRQVDCLRDIGDALGNADGRLWTMRNGYALCTEHGLAEIDRTLKSLTDDERDALRARLRIGVHSGVEVTSGPRPGHLVSQAFCSALPVAYSNIPAERWASFASLVLEGTYEATLHAGIVNAVRTGSAAVYLTRVGGGAFGNETAWIDAAIVRALSLVAKVGLDVRLVSFGQKDPAWERLAGEWAAGRTIRSSSVRELRSIMWT